MRRFDMEIKGYTPRTVYAELKEELATRMAAEEDDIRCYWNDNDPKYINAVAKAERRLDQLKMIDAFIEEHKEELDRY